MTTRTSRLTLTITTTRQPDGSVTHRADYADEPLEPGIWRAVEALADVEAGREVEEECETVLSGILRL